MNTINSIVNQQTQRVAQNSALRKAASSPKLPNLTNDESTWISQKFSESKSIRSYSMDGKVNEHQMIRGSHFDARI
jgi:hypothetical protein